MLLFWWELCDLPAFQANTTPWLLQCIRMDEFCTPLLTTQAIAISIAVISAQPMSRLSDFQLDINLANMYLLSMTTLIPNDVEASVKMNNCEHSGGGAIVDSTKTQFAQERSGAG
jgi:hypothetical protein